MKNSKSLFFIFFLSFALISCGSSGDGGGDGGGSPGKAGSYQFSTSDGYSGSLSVTNTAYTCNIPYVCSRTATYEYNSALESWNIRDVNNTCSTEYSDACSSGFWVVLVYDGESGSQTVTHEEGGTGNLLFIRTTTLTRN